MQKNTKKNILGPKQRQMHRLGPFRLHGPALAAVSFVLAAVGLRWPSLHFVGCHGRSLAAVDGHWLLWMVVGCCEWSLAAVDLSSPALAAVDLRWLLWAVVVAFVGVVQAKGGYVDVDVVSVVQRLTW